MTFASVESSTTSWSSGGLFRTRSDVFGGISVMELSSAYFAIGCERETLKMMNTGGNHVTRATFEKMP